MNPLDVLDEAERTTGQTGQTQPTGQETKTAIESESIDEPSSVTEPTYVTIEQFENGGKNIVVVTSNAIEAIEEKKSGQRKAFRDQLIDYNKTQFPSAGVKKAEHPDDRLKTNSNFVALEGGEEIRASIVAWLLGSLDFDGNRQYKKYSFKNKDPTKIDAVKAKRKELILFGVVQSEDHITDNNAMSIERDISSINQLDFFLDENPGQIQSSKEKLVNIAQLKGRKGKNVIIVTSDAIKMLSKDEREQLQSQWVTYNSTTSSNHPIEGLRDEENFVALTGELQVKDSIVAWLLGSLKKTGNKYEKAVGDSEPILFGSVERKAHINEQNFEDGILYQVNNV